MNNLENRLDRASSGEFRLNPDEQKLYLNTFRERVLLAVSFSDAKRPEFKSAFDMILQQFDLFQSPIYVKISGDLPDDLTGYFLKTAIEHAFEGQILTEHTADTYGLVVHTDHAINQEKIDLASLLPDLNLSDTPTTTPSKKGFFSKFFH